ncbi:MAG TPA: ATP-dependent Clp protease ATP-binding subunit [Fibrobacteria bacterium]|nr:ATP-dependent Clp protease ATP-binding subunit [Fibrobacteria bacterium]
MNGMFTDRVKKVMQLAREESVRLGNDYVGTEHLLLGLIREGDGVAIAVLRNQGVDLEELSRSIEKQINTSGGMMTIGQMIPFTPRAKKVLEIAAQEARAMSHKYIGTEHILLALMKDNESAAASALVAVGVDYDTCREEIDRVLRGSESGAQQQPAPGLPEGAQIPGAGKKKSKTPFLDHFGRDLTELAKAGKLDPIIGRDAEIERVIQILSRRKKNNPLLIGEPGVGKTAVVEGLALKIVERKIPEVLESKRVVTLDMASIVAGTKYRGQFEERLKALMVELQKNDNVITFIDEIHTIVGAGGSEGSLDASNIFKPALARGELQCIGATTFDEYRKHIEKDGALERRFQTITIEPPSADETVEILKGLKERYEKHHKVVYTLDAIEAAVKLSERYMSNRFLPDKAIDLIDEAGARIRLSSLTVPPSIRELEDKVAEVVVKKEQAVADQDYEAAARFRDDQEKLQEQLAQTKVQWKAEKGNERLEVNEDIITDVVSKMTGIPISKVDATEGLNLLALEDDLHKRVVGQERAIEVVAKAIRRSRAGFHNNRRPIGSFMFLGPTGVGKTELCKALAEVMFKSQDSLVRIDMSEYMEKFAVSRLVGAPPGYVGYEEGGQLTEKIRKKPYAVVLLDEIEKAHPDVFNMLLQILDDGHLTDSFGRKINFRNTVIIMTSNLGARDIKRGGLGFSSGESKTEFERMERGVMDELKRTFNPEFLNRVDETIVFHPLTKLDLEKIIEIQLAEVQTRLSERKVTLVPTASAKELLVEKSFDPLFGARPLRRSIQKLVEDALAEDFLRGKFQEGDTIRIERDGDALSFHPEAKSA